MEILFFPFVLLIAVPGGAFLPALLLLLWVRQRWTHLGPFRRLVSGAAVFAWLAYAPYETWMYFWMQSVIAPIRVDLLLIGPVLLIGTVAAIAACYAQTGKVSNG
jgi:hypothetical protein